MTDQPKRTPLSYKAQQFEAEKSERSAVMRFLLMISGRNLFLPLLSGVLLLMSGLILVSITILGFITPLWISAFLTLFGSISSMVGVFLIYQTVSSRNTFETLVTKAIRRAVKSQN